MGKNDLSSDCMINTISETTKFDAANGLAPRRTIGDSGAAKDIMGNNDLRSGCVINTISETTKFDIASGLVSSNQEVTYWPLALDEFVTATLLDQSVPILSIGKRCAHQG
eukprot:10380734-Heterocapsa_arctica.AAC.1